MRTAYRFPSCSGFGGHARGSLEEELRRVEIQNVPLEHSGPVQAAD